MISYDRIREIRKLANHARESLSVNQADLSQEINELCDEVMLLKGSNQEALYAVQTAAALLGDK